MVSKEICQNSFSEISHCKLEDIAHATLGLLRKTLDQPKGRVMLEEKKAYLQECGLLPDKR